MKEKEQWENWMSQGFQQGEQLVNVKERDKCVWWIICMVKHYKLGPDTQCMAAVILDYMLSTARVQSKYLRCLALSTLCIACKVCEEPEAVPQISELIQGSGCTYSFRELLRMERVVLKHLKWNLSFVTPYTFLQLMLAVSFTFKDCCSMLRILRPFLNHICGCSELQLVYRCSVLTLAAFSLVLERYCPKQWLTVALCIQQQISISHEKFIACREDLVKSWAKEHNSVGLPLDIASHDDGHEVLLAGNVGAPLSADRTSFSSSSSSFSAGSHYRQTGSSRKRRRQKSRNSQGDQSSLSSSKGVVDPPCCCVEEISDALGVLYGKGLVEAEI
ncbi:unnamed protein product [Soboliphyme baturini]|uniref:CYCLIN domain-containing protein n=1 Tax=Soboliphyme baturini TaxID=241478 RepID=A0A183J0Q4_9BILA|nr:unnamed protein product [Soboliphyme baturini]